MKYLLIALGLLGLVSCGEESSGNKQPTPSLSPDAPGVPIDPDLKLGPDYFKSIEITKRSCFGSDVQTLSLPVNHDYPEEASFPYRFQFVDNKVESTIIHIPGGPGQTAIGTEASKKSLLYNHIFIDPRGMGCNFQPKSLMSDDLLASKHHASDIIAIIENLGLESYAIYGVSYGTVVATHISHLLKDRKEMPQPKAVVLEGVLGKAMQGDEYEQNFKRQWEDMKARIPGLGRLFQDSEKLPLAYTSSEWTTLLTTLLSYGGETAEVYFVALVNPHNYEEGRVKKVFDKLLGKDEKHQELDVSINYTGYRRVYNNVGCKEIFDTSRYVNYLVGETFEVFDLADYLEEGLDLEGTVGLCTSVELSDPFDASDYQMTDVPTYYVHGENDPRTSLEGAKYHFESQEGLSKKFFVEVTKAGHNPLGIQLDDCSTAIWWRIFRGEELQSYPLNMQGLCNSRGIAVGTLSSQSLGNLKNINF